MTEINHVTVARKGQENYLAALLYDDVHVWEQWESDTTVAVIWTRETDSLGQYQAARLDSGWFPTRTGFDGLRWLVDEMGLHAPCL